MADQTLSEGLLPDASVHLPTEHGLFQLNAYIDSESQKEHLALIAEPIVKDQSPIVRIHSECLTGDVFNSHRCDCGSQLEHAMKLISASGGVLVYLRQEGRGIGLLEKLKAYKLQEQGFDTIEANEMLGHQADSRDYGFAARILWGLGVRKIKLLTNNPEKVAGMEALGIEVEQRLKSPGVVTDANRAYLQTKVEKFRHLISLPSPLNKSPQISFGGKIREEKVKKPKE